MNEQDAGTVAYPRSRTPGPWKIATIAGASGREWWDITTEDGVCIASEGEDGSRTPNFKNARLIAAAPDLLAACEALSKAWDAYMADDRFMNPHDCISHALFDALGVAVAKAKSEAQAVPR